MRTLIILATVACAAAATRPVAEGFVTSGDLAHHRWVLERINGDPLPPQDGGGKIPALDFGERATLSGNTGCNLITGEAFVENGSFQIEPLSATRRMCSPVWNDIERTLTEVLSQRSKISLDDDMRLILETPTTRLTYRLQDWKT
jgi:heat shock protein HslJ